MSAASLTIVMKDPPTWSMSKPFTCPGKCAEGDILTCPMASWIWNQITALTPEGYNDVSYHKYIQCGIYTAMVPPAPVALTACGHAPWTLYCSAFGACNDCPVKIESERVKQ